LFVVDDDVFGCVTSHCKFVGVEFNSDAENCTVCAGVTPTGTVTAAGVIATRMPESSDICVVPVFEWSASAVAVNVTVGTGAGKLPNEGAVYVSTLEPLAAEVTNVPMVPPFTDWPEVHAAGFVATGLGTAVVGSGVNTYVQVHATVVVVAGPLTAAVNENACPATTVAAAGLTVTVTTLALPPPQPAMHKIVAQIAASSAAPLLHRNFITDVSPVPISWDAHGTPLLISMPIARCCVVPLPGSFSHCYPRQSHKPLKTPPPSRGQLERFSYREPERG
jgi:hypothetical protein